MKKCVKCGREISDTAKFCGHCQAKQEIAMMECPSVKELVCPDCRSTYAATSKFYTRCGQRLVAAQETNTNFNAHVEVSSDYEKHVDQQRGFITWSVLPGQLAVKIDEKEMDQYGFILIV